MALEEFRKSYPQYNDLSDAQVADSLYEKHYSDIPKDEYYAKIGVGAPPSPEEAARASLAPRIVRSKSGKQAHLVDVGFQTQPPLPPGTKFTEDTGAQALSAFTAQPEKPEAASSLRRVADVGISAVKGAIGVPESIVGLADIVTGGRSGKLAEETGFRPKEAKAILDEYLSPQQQAANKALADTSGFFPTIGTALQNPSTILHSAIESLPLMGAGGVAARGLVKAAGISPWVAGAIGEGLASAGQNAEQVRQETPGGLLSPGQTATQVASGFGTGALALAGAGLARKLNINDIDTWISGGKLAAPVGASGKGFARRLAEGAISEGMFEELPQSLQEQMWQNYALDKPIMEGVTKAGAMGMLTGAVMGGPAAALAGNAQMQAVPNNQLAGELERVMASKRPVKAELAKIEKEKVAQVLQNRNRSSKASIVQMHDIAGDPDPARLSFSRDFLSGAPTIIDGGDIPAAHRGRQDQIVTAGGRSIPVQYAVVEAAKLLPSHSVDGTPNAGYTEGAPNKMRVIAGNGRAAGIKGAYAIGTAAKYAKGIGEDTALHGVPKQAIAALRQPVLVRIMPESEVTANMGDETNIAATAALSPAEKAATDARRVDVTALEFGEDGEITPQAVRQFVTAMPETERSGLIDENGEPTRQAYERLTNAVFMQAYQDVDLVSLQSQATDQEARAVMAGLVRAAAPMAKLEGAGGLDIRPIVIDAAKAAINAKRAGASLATYAKQRDIELPEDAYVVLKFFANNLRSARKIGDGLIRVATTAAEQAGKPAEDMFGAVPKMTRAEILRRLENEGAGAEVVAGQAGARPPGPDVGGPAVDREGPALRQTGQAYRPAGEFELEAQTPEQLAAKAAEDAARVKAEKEAARAEEKKAKRERIKTEYQRRAEAILAEREAAKKAEIDAGVATFALGQETPNPVVKKVTTEEAAGQESLFQPKQPYNPNQEALFSQPANTLSVADALRLAAAKMDEAAKPAETAPAARAFDFDFTNPASGAHVTRKTGSQDYEVTLGGEVALTTQNRTEALKFAAKPEKAVEAAPAAKEPWQMTRAEWFAKERGIEPWLNEADRMPQYRDASRKLREEFAGRLASREAHEALNKTDLAGIEVSNRTRASEVRRAITEGKPVPAEVLADYPDLNPEAQPPTREAESQAPALSESGDRGVAPTREGGAPEFPGVAELKNGVYDVGEVTDENKVSAPRRKGPPKGEAAQERDLLTETEVSRQENPKPAIVVGTIQRGEMHIGFDRLDTPEKAAQAFAALRKSPFERFQIIVTDANDKPIAAWHLFSGTLTQTSVYSREVLTATYMTPGAKKVWFAHNHPSGAPIPSHADETLTRALAEGLGKDIGVEFAGHIIIAGRKAHAFDNVNPGGAMNYRGMPGYTFDIPAASRKFAIPIMERVIKRQSFAERPSLSAPSRVREYIRGSKFAESGLVLMDAQNRPLGFWPMTIEQMGKLRTGDTETGAGRIMQMVGRLNPGAAIAYIPGTNTPEIGRAVRNIGALLNKIDTRLLDAFIVEPGEKGAVISYAEKGIDIKAPTFQQPKPPYAAGPRPMWADELESVGGKIDPDGTVLLWHATTKEKSAQILETGILRRPADAPDTYGVYFGTGDNYQYLAESYSDGTLIPVRARARDLKIEDVGPGKLITFYAQTKNGVYKPVAVGDVALRETKAERPKQEYDFKQLELLYDHIETRPGTTPEQKALGLSAVRSLFEGDRRAGASLLGSALWKDFIEHAGAELIGQQADSPAQLALLAQILRGPRFETMRIFFVKGDKIVDYLGWTSRMPGSVAFGVEGRRGVGRIVRNAQGKEVGKTFVHGFYARMDELKARMKASGADGYFILHNHPSGFADASIHDSEVTRRVAKSMPGFRGHVIIDHNEYGTINDQGHARVINLPVRARRGAAEPELAHDVLGRTLASSGALVEVGKMLTDGRKGYATLIATNAQGEVQALAEMPETLLLGKTEYQKLRAIIRVRRFMENTGSAGGAFLVAENPSRFDWMLERGAMTDIAPTLAEQAAGQKKTRMQSGEVTAGEFLEFGRGARMVLAANQITWHGSPYEFEKFSLHKIGTGIKYLDQESRQKGEGTYNYVLFDDKLANIVGVEQPAPRYGDQTETPEFKRWFSGSKVVDAEGKPLVVYHGTDADIHAFDEWKQRSPGFYFTSDGATASEWAEHHAQFGAVRGVVYPTFLKMENPLEVEANRRHWSELPDPFGGRRLRRIDGLAKEALERGFDGMIVHGLYDAPDTMQNRTKATTYIVFEPTQIKSAAGNRGTFDPESANILEQPAPIYTVTEAGGPVLEQEGLSIEEPKEWDKRGDVTYFDSVVTDGVGNDLGVASLGWSGDQVKELLYLKSFKTRQGLGTKVLGAILAHNAPDATLHIRYIQPSSREFWEKAGVEIVKTETGEDGFLTKAAFDAARDRGAPEAAGTATAADAQADQDVPTRLEQAAPKYVVKAPLGGAGAIAAALSDITSTQRTFNLYHRTIGTQPHKAKISPEFGAVYKRVSDYIADATYIAMEAHAKTTKLLPLIEKVRELGKMPPPTKDLEAVMDALAEGTLAGGGSPLKGRIWADSELKAIKMTDRQIALYHEALNATGVILDELGKSIIYRLQRKDIGLSREAFDQTSLDDIAQVVRDEAENLRDDARLRLDRAQQANDEAGVAKAQAEIDNLEKLLDSRDDKGDWIYGAVSKAERQAFDLKAHGYFPLMRFGRYGVIVKNAKGITVERLHYDFETAANRDFRRLTDLYAKSNPDYTVTRAVLPEKSHQMFQGMSPDAIELFADSIMVPNVDANGNVTMQPLSQDAALQAYIKDAVSSRSAMKRHIHRKGIPGFSTDVSRVLSSFIESGGRLAASNYHMADAVEAWSNIPDEMGDVKDEATALIEFIRDPDAGGSKLGALAFNMFLGGDFGQFLINRTQPVTAGLPWLMQYTSAADAADKLFARAPTDQKYRQALQKAKDEGLVAPQELYQLRAYTRARIIAPMLPTYLRQWPQKFATVWGAFMSMSEQSNREQMFKAAWLLANEKPSLGDPMEFAERAIKDTQVEYGRAAIPNLARNPYLRPAFVFAQFKITMFEMFFRLARHYPKAAAMMLFILFMLAGIEGEPFAENIEDMVDALGRWGGLNTNSRAKLRELITAGAYGLLNDMTDEETAKTAAHRITEALMRGPLSVATGIDFSGRFSMGRPLPGTKMLSQGLSVREVASMYGPPGAIFANWFEAIKLLGEGKTTAAVKIASPRSVQNVAQGTSMFTTGEYRDIKGRKVDEATKAEAVAKMLGLHPENIGRGSRARSIVMDTQDLRESKQEEIYAKWASGILDKDPEQIKAAKDALKDWNTKNPKARIVPKMSSVRPGTPQAVVERVRAARRTADQRLLKAAPKTMRPEVRRQLEEAR